MKKIFTTLNPALSIEFWDNNIIGDVYLRIDAGADGKYEGNFDLLGSSGTWEEHLMRLLQASGRPDITSPLQAVILMQSTPAAEFEAMCLSGWAAMLKDLGVRVNQLWKAATGQLPTSAHQDVKVFFAAMLARTQASTDANNQAVFTVQ